MKMKLIRKNIEWLVAMAVMLITTFGMLSSFMESFEMTALSTIINYVRVNGDIELKDIANTEPFVSCNLLEMFGEKYPVVINIVNLLHNSIIAA